MEWLGIRDHPSYEVSSCGKVRNKGTGLLLKDRVTKAGYNRCRLGGKDLSIHRLVANHFLPNPDNLPQVNHKDCDKLNNKLSNLEWCSAESNMQHAWSNGLMANVPNPPAKKRKLHSLRNPEGVVMSFDIVELSEVLGVGRGKFYQVAKGTRKQHCGYTKP